MSEKSGRHWVQWADLHAPNSHSLDDLEDSFGKKVTAFIDALLEAGASVNIQATRRHAKRAYLFHWSWLISLGKIAPSDAKPLDGVDIEWDHGDAAASQAAAMEMVRGFGLATPPKSIQAPALRSNHILGKAIDMFIDWNDVIEVRQTDGTVVPVVYNVNPNANVPLHAVGKSYGVVKDKHDAPHWSFNGH